MPGRWELRGIEPASPLQFLAPDAAGELEVSPGLWEIRSLDPRWKLINERCHVFEGSVTPVWVQRTTGIEVLVVDPRAAPIAGADVRWAPRRFDDGYDPLRDWQDLTLSPALPTDVAGIAQLSAVGLPGVVISVAAEHHRPRVLCIDSCDVDRIEVVLGDPEDGTVSLRVRDRSTFAPIAEVRCSASTGDVRGVVSDANGEMQLPRWLLEDSFVRFHALGCADTGLPGSRIVSGMEVRMSPASAVTFRCVDASAALVEDAVIQVVRTQGTKADESPAIWDSRAKPCVRGQVTLQLPIGVALTACAHDRLGRGVSMPVQLSQRAETVTLVLASSSSLDVRITDEALEPLANARVAAESASLGTQHTKSDADGAARVALPALVALIRVDAPSRASVVLEPRGVGNELAGQVEVRSMPERSVQITLTNEEGAPVSGARITLRPVGGTRTANDDPVLRGSEPTNHPKWVRNPRPFLFATTDALGRALARGLERGVSYSGVVEVPAWMRPDTVVQSPFALAAPAHRIEPDEERVTWEVPSTVAVTFDVLDGASRNPVEGFSLWSVRYGRALLEPAMSHVDVVLASTETDLRISKTGFEETVLAVAELVAHAQRNVVLLWPGEPSRIDIDDPAGVLRGRTLRVRAWRVDARDASRRISADELWSGDVWVDPARGALVHVPAAAAFLTIDDLRIEGATYRFIGVQDAWTPGAVLEFAMQPR